VWPRTHANSVEFLQEAYINDVPPLRCNYANNKDMLYAECLHNKLRRAWDIEEQGYYISFYLSNTNSKDFRSPSTVTRPPLESY